MTYIPLHVHSHYSLLDGLSKPKQIVQRLNEIEADGCALTDHGSISGSINFLQTMQKAGKKPIIGCELYVCDLHARMKEDSNRALKHLLVYAKNDAGWKELVSLISESNDPDHFYYKPRLSLEQLKKYSSQNLLWVSGHLGSHIADSIMNNSLSDTVKLVEWFKDAFGKDNFFLEVQLIAKDIVPEMASLTESVREIGKTTNTKVVATPDAHYCCREDADDQRILLCRNLGSKTLEEARESSGLHCFFHSNSFHIPSYQEMIDCGHTKEELENTLFFAASCSDYKDILCSPMLPTFDCPDNKTPDEYLRELCRIGWKDKIENTIPKEKQQRYIDRVKEELTVLQGANLSSYFLIVQDILSFVNNNNWLPGPARGSAAGCLVSYLINITKIDPIKYNLLFTRFYNQGRNTKDHISLPDIDVDVPITTRDAVIQYIKDKYGHDKVSQMITYQTMKGRGALKDVLRAYGMSFTEMNEITKLIPEEAKIADELQQMEEDTGKTSIIQWALEHDKKAKKLTDWCYLDDNNNLQGPYAKRFEQAMRLEGTKSSQSKHAAGIVVTPIPLHEMCPMVYDTKNKVLVAGLEMNDLEAIGGLKLDILGIALLDKLMGTKDILETGDIHG